jgi:hypothetical protein
MPFPIRTLARTHSIALVSLVLLAVITFAIGKHANLTQVQHPASRAGAAPLEIVTRASAAADAPQGVIQLLLRPEGFDSRTLAIAKGRYILILLNRTGLEDLALQVSRVVGNGEKPKDIMFDSRKKYRIDNLIDLTPGDYVVTVQGHPEWVCRITTRNQ